MAVMARHVRQNVWQWLWQSVSRLRYAGVQLHATPYCCVL